MRRYLEPQLLQDLARKTVVLTGARRVGKTTMARQLMERCERAQVLNWDVPVDRAVHHCHIVEIGGDSHRRTDADRRAGRRRKEPRTSGGD
jgi:hypothetical protein